MSRIRNRNRHKYSAPVALALALSVLAFGSLLASCAASPAQNSGAELAGSSALATPQATVALPAATMPPTLQAAQAATLEPAETQVATHTVAAGETITRIALRYDISVSELLAVNDLPNPNLLEVGQALVLPEVVGNDAEYTDPIHILADSRLVRSVNSSRFDVAAFVADQPGALRDMAVTLGLRQVSAAHVVERVSREYSVDARVLLAFLEHFARLLSSQDVDDQARLYPLLRQASGANRAGLYSQLSWLADRLNQGYYDWKYRDGAQMRFADNSSLRFSPSLNAATVAVQYALSQLLPPGEWRDAASDSGWAATYRALFGDPFADAHVTVPQAIRQPELTLPFPRGEIWRFTGGFHGGWGNGSAWSAIDFAPPDEAAAAYGCYKSSFAATAVADGVIARLAEGLVVLDLDGDGNEGSGWTILYLHIDHHNALQVGQTVSAGNLLGYPACIGGYSNATHLHIARRYNGEWLPADCARCPTGSTVPPFVMSGWRVVGLDSQLYQGFLVHQADNRSVVAEQGRYNDINAISW
ncbi:MAG: LysM peptidoglycan-binding domain-containing protein [Chloroflexi bacterium]|nr:LysM peptidoglycan-binding domain-containing protein [Chloroflexota bacterium]MCY4246262.1 LysM peptidoglycan-binding domain-containing protein [Chloroflexota bacterium]